MKHLPRFLPALFAGAVLAAGLPSCSKTAASSAAPTLYDGALEEVESSWRHSDDAVSLDFARAIGSNTFEFSDTIDDFNSQAGLSAFRTAVDKAIEWTSVAKKNKVTETVQQIEDVGTLQIPYGFNNRYAGQMFLQFYFRVLEWESKTEYLLLIRYDPRDIDNGLHLIFKEKDFKALKKTLSDESFVEARKKAEEKAQADAVFK